MKTRLFSPRLQVPGFVALGLFAGAMPSIVRAAEADEVVAVYSSVSPWYKRTPLPGGGFKPETYAFGEGGARAGTLVDQSADNLKFLEVAHIMADALATQNYLPSVPPDPKQTDLLIMVYWGTTTGTDDTARGAEYNLAQSMRPFPLRPESTDRDHPSFGHAGPTGIKQTAGDRHQEIAEKNAAESALEAMLTITALANRTRDRQDAENAAILGYSHEMKRLESYTAAPLRQRRQDVVDEIEEARYYVVLLAYDFRELHQHKLKKLHWVTRFSIRERHNDFAKQLAAMAQSAARSFGQDAGLVRRPIPTAQVKMGELKSLGEER